MTSSTIRVVLHTPPKIRPLVVPLKRIVPVLTPARILRVCADVDPGTNSSSKPKTWAKLMAVEEYLAALAPVSELRNSATAMFAAADGVANPTNLTRSLLVTDLGVMLTVRISTPSVLCGIVSSIGIAEEMSVFAVYSA